MDLKNIILLKFIRILLLYFSFLVCSLRWERLIFSPLHCPLFRILVSYRMLNTAVKGFFYKEAVTYENA